MRRPLSGAARGKPSSAMMGTTAGTSVGWSATRKASGRSEKVEGVELWMSVMQKEVRKCKHERCTIDKFVQYGLISLRSDWRTCKYYVQDCDGCDY